MSGTFDYITQVLDRAIEDARPIEVKGRVIQVVGTIVKAAVPGVKIGEVCILRNPWENYEVRAEVVGFTKGAALLTALGTMTGISAQTEVIPTRKVLMVPTGDTLLGRVVDGLGRPLDADKKGPLRPQGYYPVLSEPPGPLERRIISKPISLGIRAIDGMLTCGEGQRLGIFAAAGGGKSTLLAEIIRNTEAEVSVLALIGERGREVREFIEKDLGPEGMKRAVVVCATSDRSAMERLKAAYVATSIAESFRDEGADVVLMMAEALGQQGKVEDALPYLNKIRIEQVKRLMEKPGCATGALGRRVGYDNESYFIRQFKKRCGTTPKQFRMKTRIQAN